MANSSYDRPSSKSNKLVAIPTKPPPTLRLGGMEPATDMEPGTYRVSCTGAAVERGRVVIHYQVIEGPHTGTELRQWIPIPASGVISHKSRYAQQCAVALGRPLDAGDNLNNPAAIFFGRHFIAQVGYRKTLKPRGGKYAEEYALYRKDATDGLKVHAVVDRVEL